MGEMYKSKKKPKKESPALKFIREKREEQWEQIQKNVKRGKFHHDALHKIPQTGMATRKRVGS